MPAVAYCQPDRFTQWFSCKTVDYMCFQSLKIHLMFNLWERQYMLLNFKQWFSCERDKMCCFASQFYVFLQASILIIKVRKCLDFSSQNDLSSCQVVRELICAFANQICNSLTYLWVINVHIPAKFFYVVMQSWDSKLCAFASQIKLLLDSCVRQIYAMKTKFSDSMRR